MALERDGDRTLDGRGRMRFHQPQHPDPFLIGLARVLAQAARLGKALKAAEERGVDLVVVDTPARKADASLEAAKLANLVVLPCRTQIYDLETVPSSRELVAVAGNTPTLVVLNAVPSRGSRAEQTRTAVTDFGLPVCSVTLGQRAAFGDAATRGLTALEYQPSGKAADESRKVYKYVYVKN